MKAKSTHIYAGADDSISLWNWKAPNDRDKKKSGKRFPVTEFIQDNYKKVEELLSGPGFGIGIGCGIGAGLGLVGGVGLPWNQPQLVFGVGMGCGTGFGFGYGRGIGYGSSWDSSVDYILNGRPSKSRKKRL
ncbi:hypothetical protein Tsubulata_008935 [Turnera subulata]|uniref:Uncharacterized protein n=1 Tax=Turnera subulata TaxID=218843 RepID=A0A9Q0EZX5_9ROSI|nr:hypothetical protein Tsubulata_008935 [Turnera subulata]